MRDEMDNRMIQSGRSGYGYRRESRAMRMIRERRRKRKLIRYGLAVMLMLSILMLSTSMLAYAEPTKASEQSYKYYTSICIEKGQTLQDIAGIYMTKEYRNMEQYISEVKHMNHLSSDQIHSGCYLIVPYYSTEILD